MKEKFAKVALIAMLSTGVLGAENYYVSVEGSDSVNDGRSVEAAFATIARAVNGAADGDTIVVLPGTYEITSAISMLKGITIVGATGNPEDVIVRNTAGNVTLESGANSQVAYRVAELNHAGAVLSGITAEGGKAGGAGDNRGANIWINSNGGTVTNCIIRNGVICGIGPGATGPKNGAGAAGIACESANGLITHCVITNNMLTRGNGINPSINLWQWGGAAGALVRNGGKIRHSLIAYNCTTNDNFGSAVMLDNNANTVMENCTVAANSGLGEVGNFCPLMYYSQSTAQRPVVRNTLMYGNTGIGGSKDLFCSAWLSSQVGKVEAAQFLHCATDATLPANFPAGLGMITSGLLISSDFRPMGGSSTVDAGGALTAPVTLDLLGNERVYGEAVDIGCYEYVGDEPSVAATAKPEFTPADGSAFYPTLEVTLRCPMDDAEIYYTLDGSEPTEASFRYGGAIFLTATTTVRARAYMEGLEGSEIVSATYTYDVPVYGYFVGPMGSDVGNDGKSREAAFATIEHALQVAKEGQWIRVLAGTYEITSEGINVEKGVEIVGDTGHPEDVIVRNINRPTTMETGANHNGAYRVFVLNHANAVVSSVTAEGGNAGGGNDFKGANIWINTNGGTVTNCIIRNGVICGIGPGGAKNGASGAGIASESANGLITHCVITNNFVTRGNGTNPSLNLWQWGGAAGALVRSGGKIRHSLIAYNHTRDDNFGSAVLLDNNANTGMENCTIAENSGLGDVGNFCALMYYSQSAAQRPIVRNTLLYGNTGVGGSRDLFCEAWYGSQIGNISVAQFVNCATDANVPSGLSFITEEIALATGFRPSSMSSLIDAGAPMLAPVTLDLAGNERVWGHGVDIGCYECQHNRSTLIRFR